MLPPEIATRLKLDPHHLAHHHEKAIILFADIVGYVYVWCECVYWLQSSLAHPFVNLHSFTAMSSSMTARALVEVLNELFTRFDHLVDKYIQTQQGQNYWYVRFYCSLSGQRMIVALIFYKCFSGDCYMVTSIPTYQDPDKAAAAMCHFSLDMIETLKQFNVENPANKLDLRIGMNTVEVVAGVVGTTRFVYDLWGDAVNLASRMESTGIPSRVQITKS